MHTFALKFKDGHPIFQSDTDILLLDTGAPTTVHEAETLSFCGEKYKCPTIFQAFVDVEQISLMVGTRITTLLGVDILKEYKILLDYRAGTVKFSKDDIPFDDEVVAVPNAHGIPIVELLIAGKPVKCFLDSGAKLSFMPMEITQNYPSQGIVEDFFPTTGIFHTESYLVPVTFKGGDLTIKCGNLPENLELIMALFNVKGILGYDFFNAYSVLLDLGNSRVGFLKYSKPN